MRKWQHKAVEVVVGDRRECRVCGDPVTGHRQTLRHLGQEVQVVRPEPEDAAAFMRALAIADATVRQMPAGATEDDLTRAVVQNLYRSGALRRRPVRGPVVITEQDDPPREPDHAELAAGETLARAG